DVVSNPSVDSGQKFQRNSETRTCQSICNWMRPVTLLTRLTNKNCDYPWIWRDMRITPENEYYHEVSLHGVVRLTRFPGAVVEPMDFRELPPLGEPRHGEG